MPYVTIRGRRMFYEEHGSGFPVLFGHSYLWEAAMWEPQVQTLAQTYRCIVPELWGHGRSEPLPAIPTSLNALADDFWALTQALELQRFAVVGLSVGGMWATYLTLNHPEAVAALVIMDSHVGAEPPASQARFFQMLDMLEKAGVMPPPLAEACPPFFFAGLTFERQPELVQRFKNHLLALPAAQIPSIVALGRAIFGRASIMERLGEITAPTLVVVGEDDRSRPPHEAQAMAGQIPGARLAIIKEAGHICTQEQPAAVTALLADFLAAAIPAQP